MRLLADGMKAGLKLPAVATLVVGGITSWDGSEADDAVNKLPSCLNWLAGDGFAFRRFVGRAGEAFSLRRGEWPFMAFATYLLPSMVL